MDYQLENLGPERFQMLCGALLAREYPDTRILPVGQPDGGRDVMSFHVLPGKSQQSVVYQVKYVRRGEVADPHKWLTEIVKDEAPKVARLVDRGASSYRLMTNVRGTAHLDAGSIDRTDAILAAAMPIPATCWWRDDLIGRLHDAWDIKWVFPDIMSGSDFLRVLFESGMAEHSQRRERSVRAFLAESARRDATVRFNQVELHSDLLDLFVDVPARVRGAGVGRALKAVRLAPPPGRTQRKGAAYRTVLKHDVWVTTGESDADAGGAFLLLSEQFQELMPHVVLEGAPGQGKSTLAQYICQVHRLRLLQRASDLNRIPETHLEGPLRLPFRVDLRDLATWLEGGDPFGVADSEGAAVHPAPRSLEGFLATQVAHWSGGAVFDVSDLHAVLNLSATAIVLDGLDEVADIDQRAAIVSEVLAATARLEEIAASLQVVVTSRPAAFANSPGFPGDEFPHLELTALTEDLILEYSDRWVRARSLPGPDAAEVRRILRQKLHQDHMRELARNPMQLAILLSLIHTKGSSLPDKRTSLYDNYVGLFFDREAEKSPVVRDQRDLLIDIHRYLAWTLHVAVENGNSRGSIATAELQDEVAEYLRREGRDPDLAARLFHGLVERVVALVSRVEGTYEFEVQPLREYFAARHLYETAPYSPPGAERQGTKPDRFDAMARNFFWLNVTRFYAGCFSKGELPSLVTSLDALAASDELRLTSHPRVLSVMLLSDWVFAQVPRSMVPVVQLALDGLGVRHALDDGEEQLILPAGNGRDELLQRSVELLEGGVKGDYALELCKLIAANTDIERREAMWLDYARRVEGEGRTRALDHGRWMGVLARMDGAAVSELMADEPENTERVVRLAQGGLYECIAESSDRARVLLDAILDGERVNAGAYRDRETVPPMMLLADLFPVTPIDEWSGAWTRRRLWDADVDGEEPPGQKISTETEWDRACVELWGTANETHGPRGMGWPRSLQPWDRLIEQGRGAFGDRWVFYDAAVSAAGVPDQPVPMSDEWSLYDEEISLCQRARHARLRSGAGDWWQDQLATADSMMEQMFSLAMAAAWTGPRTLIGLLPVIDEKMRGLEDLLAERVISAVRRAAEVSRIVGGRRTRLPVGDVITEVSPLTMVALLPRMTLASGDELYGQALRGYDGENALVLEYVLREESHRMHSPDGSWSELVRAAKRAYSAGVVGPNMDLRHQWRDRQWVADMPFDLAQLITTDPDGYPFEFVQLAERRCRLEASSRVRPIGDIADAECWFDVA